MEACHAACSVGLDDCSVWAIVGETVRSEEGGNRTSGYSLTDGWGLTRPAMGCILIVSQLTQIWGKHKRTSGQSSLRRL